MIKSTKEILRLKDYSSNKLDSIFIQKLKKDGYCLIPPKKKFLELDTGFSTRYQESN